MSAPAHPTAARRTYFPALDGVRAIAISMVLLFHMAQQGIPIPGPIMIGQTGVDLFFVLSGFLITGILLQSPQRDWHEVRTFYLRRLLRIAPLYYTFLLLLTAAGRPIALPLWIYTQNLYTAAGHPPSGPPHLWSLAVEEQFYLAWPFVVLFLPRRSLLGSLLLLLVLALLCRPVLLLFHISPFTFTLSRLDTLAGGALLALLLQQGRLTRLRLWLVLAFLSSAAVLSLEGALARHAGLHWIEITKFSLLALLYTSGLGLVLLLSPAHRGLQLLSCAPLRFVSRLAYGLYIVHPVVFAAVFLRLARQPPALRALAGLLASLACALLSWYGLERPFLRLKDRLAPERARFPRSAPPISAL